MKFIVRAGFVVHDRKVVEIGGQPQVQESSYYEGQEVDFDEATAQLHAHKLEPVCKKADAYLSAKHPAPVAPAAAPGTVIDYALLAQAIVAAQALVAAAPSSAG
jgi:hypothetical protein